MNLAKNGLALSCILLVCLSYQAVEAQNWNLVYKSDADLKFHMTQKNGEVYVSRSTTTIPLFVRITDGGGQHNRFFFGEQTFLQLSLPDAGFIALMSEDESNMTQYIYASERIERVKFADNDEFFAFAEKVSAAEKGRSVASKPKEAAEPKGPKPASNSDEEHTLHHVVVVTSDEHNDFDPKRKTTEDRPGSAPMTEPATKTETPVAESDKAALEELTAQIRRLSRQVQDLQHQLSTEQLPSQPEEVLLGRQPVRKISYVVTGYSGFFKAENGCDNCNVSEVTGIPVVLSQGISINYPKSSLAIMLSLGVQLHKPNQGELRYRPSAGGRWMLFTEKYAFSGSVLSTRSFDSILVNAGIGIPLTDQLVVMMEAGYMTGHMHLLSTRAFASNLGLSLTYNFRKFK